MSRVLKRVFYAPLGAPWQSWIHHFGDVTSPDAVQQQLDAVIGAVAPRLVPVDVRNLIVAHMFTPGLVADDEFIHPAQWLEKWVQTPVWQDKNPLYLARAGPTSTDALYCLMNGPSSTDAIYCLMNGHGDECAACAGRFDAIAEIGPSYSLFRYDVVLGIIYDGNVKDVSYQIGPDSFPFSPDCMAKMRREDGTWVTFYYNPQVPVLPMHMFMGAIWRTPINVICAAAAHVQVVQVAMSTNTLHMTKARLSRESAIRFKSHTIYLSR
jgi:hypothetical protein